MISFNHHRRKTAIYFQKETGLNEIKLNTFVDIYYVYLLIDPRTDLPFYVGKGKDKRAYDYLKNQSWVKSRNCGFIRNLRECGFEPKVEFHSTNLSETIAFAIEEELIKFYGRKGMDENGILMNISIGKAFGKGEYHLCIGRKQSKETIAKRLANTDRNKLRSRLGIKGEQHPNFGKKMSDEQKRIMTEGTKRFYEEGGQKDIVGEKNPNYGKKHPGLNSGNKNPMFGKTGEKHPNFNKKYSDEQKDNIVKGRYKGKEERIKMVFSLRDEDRKIQEIIDLTGFKRHSVYHLLKHRERLERIL